MKPLLTVIAILTSAILDSAGQAPTPPPTPTTAQSGESRAETPENPGQPTEENLEFLERSKGVVAKIVRNERLVDPFGFPMDPSNMSTAPALSEQYEDADEIPVLNASAFKTAIEGLPISGIYPKKQTVVIGARSFAKGEQFGMKLEELTIRLRVEGIKGSSIFFKDLDTQEVASFDFNPTPVEFEPITKGKKQPRGAGIVPMDELFIVN